MPESNSKVPRLHHSMTERQVTRYSQELHCVFPSVGASMGVAELALSQALESHPVWRNLDPQRRYDLVLALHEAVANAIEHGNGGDPEKRVTLSIHLGPATALVLVGDEGDGFDLDAYQPPEGITSERGRGVTLLRATTRSLHMRAGELAFTFALMPGA